MAKTYLFLLFALLSACAFAQKVKIKGTISNEKNELLDYASVSQKHSTNGTHTNTKGQYTLSVQANDSVKLIFSSVGYQTKEYILPPLSEDILLDIVLINKSNILDSVTIEGQRNITTTIERLDHLATRRPSNPWNSLEALLVTMGGVSTNNELSNQYSVRGGNFDENVVYVNGVEIHRPQLVRSSQQEGLSFINPNMVHTVGFSAGGYNAEYGDRMSSVLDITYKKPEKFTGLAEAGLLGGEVYVGSANKHFSQSTGIRYKTTQSLLNTTDTKAEYSPSFFDLQTYMTYDISSKWTADLLLNYSRNIYQFTPQTRSTSFGTLSRIKEFKVYFDGWENDRFLYYHSALTLKGKINENLVLGFTGALSSADERERYDIEGQYLLRELDPNTGSNTGEEGILGIGRYREHARNSLKSDVYIMNHFGNLKIDKQHLIKWGLTYQREHISDNIKEWQLRDSAGYLVPNNGITVNMYSNLRSDNEIHSNRYMGFIQDTYRFGISEGLFILNFGLRASYWDFNNEFIFSPRGALAFIPQNADNFSIRLAGGVYYQAPFYREFQLITQNSAGDNVIQLNKDIRSQKSIHIVLGSDYYFNNKATRPFKLTGELYYKKLSDLIPYSLNNVKIRYTGDNMGNGYAMGLDMKLYGEFVPGAESWISFSLMKAEQNIKGIKMPLPNDQRYNLAVFYQDYFPDYERLKMSLRGLLSQGLPISVPNKGYDSGYFRTPAYRRVDIGFSWQILGENFGIRNKNSFCKTFKNIWLGLDIFNIFDMQNTNSYYWVTDVYNNQYAVPNYLTTRQLNVRLLAEF